MGVRTAIARLAAQNAHVLLVEAPGDWRIRAAAERAVLERGWSLALSPGDADILAICGEPGPSLGDAVEEVWQQLPGPRVRIELQDADEASSRLEEARHQLLDTAHHQRDAHDRRALSDRLDDSGGDMDMGGGDMDMDMGGGDAMDMGDEDMSEGGDEDMDMDGGMDMEMAPSGIPLAEGADDRDGLEMDVLHVRLGVALPYWPAGLVLRCTLQGDVIVDAIVEASDAHSESSERDQSARHVDNVVSVLALAGWEAAAADARAIRDGLLENRAQDAAERLARLHGRLQHSHLLRWSLQNIRPLDAEELQRLGIPSHLSGDTYDRLLAMVQRARLLLDGEAAPDVWVPSAELVAELVTGLDLATARLMVASLNIHTVTSAAACEESHAQ